MGLPSSAELLEVRSPHRLPGHVGQLAAGLAGSAAAVYVIDLDGSAAMLLAGDRERFPDRIRAPVGVGPEVVPDRLPLLRQRVEDRLPGSAFVPLIVRDRVMGFLLTLKEPVQDLARFADRVALELELASGYTDAVHSVRGYNGMLWTALLRKKAAYLPGLS